MAATRIQSGWEFGVNPAAVRMLITEATGPSSFQVFADTSGLQRATSGNGSIVVVDADTKWAHEDMQAVTGTGKFDDFATALKGALDAASAAYDNLNAWTYTVTYSTTTLKYTISAAEGNTTLTFESITGDDGSDTGAIAFSRLLGFNSTQSAAASHTSDWVPYFAIGAASCKSRVSDDYEPDGIVSGDYSMGGSAYAVHAPAVTTFYDWTQMFEAKSAVYKREATTSSPWTYQHMWEHVRGAFPFLVADATESGVHKLRPSAARFRPDRETADSDAYFHMPFETYLLGRI